MAKKNEGFKEILDKVWPKTKVELEKGFKEAKKMLTRGEKYLKKMSEQGAAQTKKLSLSLKREKLYYDLGKTVAQTDKSLWVDNKKIKELVSQIQILQRQVAKIK